jgi:hypothetical protein
MVPGAGAGTARPSRASTTTDETAAQHTGALPLRRPSPCPLGVDGKRNGDSCSIPPAALLCPSHPPHPPLLLLLRQPPLPPAPHRRQGNSSRASASLLVRR